MSYWVGGAPLGNSGLKPNPKNQEQSELLELTEGSLRVASYLTELPPRAVLEKKLVESIEHARPRATTQSRQNQDESP